jgi:phosphatidylglycerol:prolipoprotein diacylglycerol transferase
MISVFGLFVLLAFGFAYLAFRAEYRRKETAGVIRPFLRTERPLPPVLGGVIGWVLGAKLLYAWINRNVYIGPPADIVFSLRGNWLGGAIFAAGGWWLARRYSHAPRQVSIHPYQLMDPLLLYCGISGFAGAIGFAALENPAHIGLNGLNYYGALIMGTLVYLYINRRYGIRPAIAADIGSPGMMLAYAVGRMGCHLAGDGDWGIANRHQRPEWLSWLPDWAWAWQYPHNHARQGVYIPGCTGDYCTELVTPVYPTPLYESLACFLLFLLLWGIRKKIRRPGRLFAIFAVLNGAERFLIELIRVTPRYAIGRWDLSQAQILALAFILTGCLIGLSSRQSKTDTILP